MVFADNDRPGIMLASAARTYPQPSRRRGRRKVGVYTANDTAYLAAIDLKRAGVDDRRRSSTCATIRASGLVAAARPSASRC